MLNTDLHALRREIDLLSQLMMAKISLDDVLTLPEMILQRHALIKKFCDALRNSPEGLMGLSDHILQLQQGDHAIVKALQARRAETAQSVKNINQILSYTEI